MQSQAPEIIVLQNGSKINVPNLTIHQLEGLLEKAVEQEMYELAGYYKKKIGDQTSAKDLKWLM